MEGGFMEPTLVEKFRWRMAKWLWAPPGEMPISDTQYAPWFKLEGQPIRRAQGMPVKNKRWHMVKRSRGAKQEAPQKIDEFYHRGSYSRHETSARHTPKAVMPFRGKGSKVERRGKKRK